MIPATFEYHAPTTLAAPLSILRKYPGEARILAGGHSLIPIMKLRLARPSHLIDLRLIPDLAYVREGESGLAIGPMTTYYSLQSSPAIRTLAPLLSEAAGLVADLQVRNKGTIGGSLAHADPASDLSAALIALEAHIQTRGGGRRYGIPANRFFVDIFTTSLKSQEIISEIQIPRQPARTGSAYKKFANKASHFAVVGVAASVTLSEQGNCQRVRVGITGAGTRAIRATTVERFLEGREPSQVNLEEAAQRSGKGIDFQDDIHASSDYREHLTKVYVGRALAEAVARAI